MPDGQDTTTFDLAGRRIWVAGHRGMVGSALCRRLEKDDCTVLTVDRKTVDLTRQTEVETWMAANRPDAVFVAAARVGGIVANARFPADFLYENLMISANVLWAAHETGVEKLVYLASSCVYPKYADQPIREDSLLTGPLEATNEGYAVAKIAGLKLAEMLNRQYGRRFIVAMPTNLYGPGDNFDPNSSHVVPALIRKIHEAHVSGSDSVTIWGSGKPMRDLLYVDDAADACLFLLRHYEADSLINIGSGREISIRGLAELIAEVVGYRGGFEHDTSKPDGTPRKIVDVDKLTALGWRPQIDLRKGLASAYRAWLAAPGTAADAAPSRPARLAGSR